MSKSPKIIIVVFCSILTNGAEILEQCSIFELLFLHEFLSVRRALRCRWTCRGLLGYQYLKKGSVKCVTFEQPPKKWIKRLKKSFFCTLGSGLGLQTRQQKFSGGRWGWLPRTQKSLRKQRFWPKKIWGGAKNGVFVIFLQSLSPKNVILSDIFGQTLETSVPSEIGPNSSTKS